MQLACFLSLVCGLHFKSPSFASYSKKKKKEKKVKKPFLDFWKGEETTCNTL